MPVIGWAEFFGLERCADTGIPHDKGMEICALPQKPPLHFSIICLTGQELVQCHHQGGK